MAVVISIPSGEMQRLRLTEYIYNERFTRHTPGPAYRRHMIAKMAVKAACRLTGGGVSAPSAASVRIDASAGAVPGCGGRTQRTSSASDRETDCVSIIAKTRAMRR